MGLTHAFDSRFGSSLWLGSRRSGTVERNKAERVLRGSADARLPPTSFRTDRRMGSSGQVVSEMQAADPWPCNNPAPAGPAHTFTTGKRSLFQYKMRSVLVVATDVVVH